MAFEAYFFTGWTSRPAMEKYLSSNDHVSSAAYRSRGRPKLEDVAAMERTLLAVALKEFVRNGYGGASVNAIVKAAHVSKTTVYQRFSSKEELFRAIIRQQIARLAPMMALSLQGEANGLEQGLTSFANYALEFSLKGDMLEVNRLVYSEASRFPELGKAAAEATKIGIRQIATFIRQCACAERMPCKNPEIAAETFIYMLRGWYANVMLTNRKISKAAREKWVVRSVHSLVSGRRHW
jgi:TetR/AcrR family transcriptional regulator, mexJK operon transcriptional repressor